MNKHKIILITFLLVLLTLEVLAFQKDSHYVYDIPMCILLLFIIYRYRESLYLHVLHYLLFAIFLVLHCLGLFDAYLFYPLGIEYDYWVHGYFGLVSVLIIYRWMKRYLFSVKSSIAMFFTLFFILGISSMHELYEYFGALILGQGEGVLFIGAGDLDQWDTQKDMLNNLIGALLGLCIYFIKSALTASSDNLK